jgi:uncharacterized protein YjbI with pentapeptide repeats
MSKIFLGQREITQAEGYYFKNFSMSFERLKQVLDQWHAAHKADYFKSYNTEWVEDHKANFDAHEEKHAHVGDKYIRLDTGTSGAWMLEAETGAIYSIKGYGKVNKTKCVGDISDPDFDGADLFKYRFAKYEILNRYNGSTIYKDEAESFSALVRAAILAHANLRSANLRSANLQYADLQYADLQSANLRSANLQYADLRSANLRSANLPAPTIVLLANWGEVSETLTADLMLLDASAHSNADAFARWAAGGPCPYEGVKVQRIANFKERKDLWGKGKPDTIYNLMVRLLKEKAKTDL